VIAAFDPLKLVTLTGTSVVGGLSLLNPKTPGDNKTVSAPVVMISEITPASGAGSTPCTLLASAVLLATSVYNLTQEA
jgi:hypothetical protein